MGYSFAFAILGFLGCDIRRRIVEIQIANVLNWRNPLLSTPVHLTRPSAVRPFAYPAPSFPNVLTRSLHAVPYRSTFFEPGHPACVGKDKNTSGRFDVFPTPRWTTPFKIPFAQFLDIPILPIAYARTKRSYSSPNVGSRRKIIRHLHQAHRLPRSCSNHVQALATWVMNH